MRRHYLNPHGKPCLWPVPADCLWLYGRFETGGAVSVASCGEFATEARLLAEELQATGVVNAGVSATEQGTVRLQKHCDMPEEGYRLAVGEDGVCIRASTGRGAINGCMTLLQMVRHSFDPSIGFVCIKDSPMKPFRGVKIPFPAEGDLPWFHRFIRMIARYKANTLLLDIGDGDGFAAALRHGGRRAAAESLSGCLSARHIGVIPCMSRPAESQDALKEIISLFHAQTVAVEFPRPLRETDEKTAAQALAEEITVFHERLASLGAGLAVSSGLLHPATGSRVLLANGETGRNDILPATCGAIDLIPADILILDTNHGGMAGDSGSGAYFASRGFHTVFGDCCGALPGWEQRIACGSVMGGYVTIPEACATAMGAGSNLLAAVLRVSLLLWNAAYSADATARGVLLTLPLEKEIAVLYPLERDLLEEKAYPSAGNPGYQAIELRGHYNSPLQHSYWRADDHFMMYLQDESALLNSVPFSLFQGVLDFRYEHAFAMAGGSWNNGVFGIPVGCRASSLAFLHAYIFGKQQIILGKAGFAGNTIGQYVIRYADGAQEWAKIVLGGDIAFWKNFHGTNEGAYMANPALMGVSEEGLHYTVYAMEWVNPRPDAMIDSVDVAPCLNMDGRIALFGITAVK